MVLVNDFVLNNMRSMNSFLVEIANVTTLASTTLDSLSDFGVDVADLIPSEPSQTGDKNLWTLVIQMN